MKGFDPKSRDFSDNIIGITKEIWEDRGIATLHEYFAPDFVVRSLGSVVTGIATVVGTTKATLVEFPDRTLWRSPDPDHGRGHGGDRASL